MSNVRDEKADNWRSFMATSVTANAAAEKRERLRRKLNAAAKAGNLDSFLSRVTPRELHLLGELSEQAWLDEKNNPGLASRAFLWLNLEADVEPDEILLPRQHRLFACASCRSRWGELSLASRRAVEVAEGYADGSAKRKDLDAARRNLVPGDPLSECVYYAASYTLFRGHDVLPAFQFGTVGALREKAAGCAALRDAHPRRRP